MRREYGLSSRNFRRYCCWRTKTISIGRENQGHCAKTGFSNSYNVGACVAERQANIVGLVLYLGNAKYEGIDYIV